MYKQSGREDALLKGLEFVGPRMRHFAELSRELRKDGELMVHCWRGGMRSESMAWLWHTTGSDVFVLKGGYKAYRKYLLDFFQQDWKFVILGGKTGSGKTSILHALKAANEQILDLEGLAHHKGSSFGGIGQQQQPTVQQFENDLFTALKALDASRTIWLEDESNAIGRVFIPPPMWDHMQQAPGIVLEVAEDKRIERLVREYSGVSDEELSEAFSRIKKRLGGKQLNSALDALAKGNYEAAAKIALAYYDKAYTYAMKQRPENHVHTLSVDHDTPIQTANALIALRKNLIYPHD